MWCSWELCRPAQRLKKTLERGTMEPYHRLYRSVCSYLCYCPMSSLQRFFWNTHSLLETLLPLIFYGMMCFGTGKICRSIPPQQSAAITNGGIGSVSSSPHDRNRAQKVVIMVRIDLVNGTGSCLCSCQFASIPVSYHHSRASSHQARARDQPSSWGKRKSCQSRKRSSWTYVGSVLVIWLLGWVQVDSVWTTHSILKQAPWGKTSRISPIQKSVASWVQIPRPRRRKKEL